MLRVFRQQVTTPVCQRLVIKANRSTVATVSTADETPNVLPFDKIPGPVSLPILKMSWMFVPWLGGKYSIDHLLDAYVDIRNRYGNLVRMETPGFDMLLVYDPNDIQKIFRNEGAFPHHSGIIPLRVYRESRPDKYSTGGITTLNGKAWYDIRSKIQPHLLKPQLIQKHFWKMEETAEDMVAHVRHLMATQDGETKDFIKDLQVWAIETVSYITLNKRLRLLQQRDIDVNSDSYRMKSAAIDIFQGLSMTVFGTQLWRIYPTAGWKKLAKAHEAFAEIGLRYINEVLESVKNKADDVDLTFLEEFLTQNDVKPDDALVMALDLLLAGVDTTSNATGFLLYDLARHPDKQQTLYEEVVRVLPNKGQEVTMKDIESMPYLKACVKETLRLHPIVVGVSRKLDKEVILSNYRVPKDVYVLVTGMATMVNPQYFDAADKYQPERWLRGTKQLANHPYSYLPFGHGPRMCLGRRIAQNEMYILTSRLMQNFKVEYHHEEIQLRTGLTSTPNRPLKFKFIERSKAK